MTSRAIWKGHLKIGELVCPVALHAAVSTSERLVFHAVDRRTGHRLHRQFVDRDTGKEVRREDQTKGYEIAPDQYVILEPQDIAAVVPASDKILSVEAFVAVSEIDALYFDRPYYLTPADEGAAESFAVFRDGLRTGHVAALATAVLFRRAHFLLIRDHQRGLVATILAFDDEVRPAEQAFAAIPEIRIDPEMLDLARHIIDTKSGDFDPATFDDRYEAALADLVRAKIEGRRLEPARRPAGETVIDLKEALRRSAAAAGKAAGGKAPHRATR